MPAKTIEKEISSFRPVYISDVESAIEDYALVSDASNATKTARISLDQALNYVDASELEQIVSEAINDYVAEQVAAAYEEAEAEVQSVREMYYR